jgi:hypothetical protein
VRFISDFLRRHPSLDLFMHVSHFSRYGAVIAPMIVLAAWIYFFSLILMVGAEIVAFNAIQEANRTGQSVGPPPQNFVPSHTMMRDDIDHVRHAARPGGERALPRRSSVATRSMPAGPRRSRTPLTILRLVPPDSPSPTIRSRTRSASHRNTVCPSTTWPTTSWGRDHHLETPARGSKQRGRETR